MANMTNCTLPAYDQSNLSQVYVEMVRQDLVEFGFNDLFNVVAYAVMSAGEHELEDLYKKLTDLGSP